MMTPLRCMTGGGDQENTTSLSPGTAPNLSGDPDGAKGVEYAPSMRIGKKHGLISKSV